MSQRSFILLALSIALLPLAGEAQSVLISSYLDDPFVSQAVIKRMDPAKFGQAKDGRPTLWSNHVSVADENVVFKRDTTGYFVPYAWNSWPATWPNPRWDLTFSAEDRFPLHEPWRDAANQVVLKDGLQVWIPRDLNLGNTTAFEAANSVSDAAESWSGRPINWGDDGVLSIEAHSFIDFNALYSPATKGLFFGFIPYRLAGHAEVNMFETATSWDIAAHESAHAVHHVLKPNVNLGDVGFNTWGESFADQMAMWASLRNQERVARLLAETHGDLNQSNSLSRFAEAFAVLVGQGTGVRDAFNDKKVSDTDDEVHDRSEVLTGAMYKIFIRVFESTRRSLPDEDALAEAGRIMGLFETLASDYTPEDVLTLGDVAKAYLKVDKEIFAGRYRDVLVNEFFRRELLDTNSLQDWLAHEQALPALFLPNHLTDTDVEQFIDQNQALLGAGPDFGLKLQNVTRPSGAIQGRMVIRIQLNQGRGKDATALNNHGILVFRANGDIADYHPPIPGVDGNGSGGDDYAQAISAIGKARQVGLHLHGAPISLVRRPDRSFSVEARIVRGGGLNAYIEAFTDENPNGVRRELLQSPLSLAQRLKIAAMLEY
jgi:hypothetical protein